MSIPVVPTGVNPYSVYLDVLQQEFSTVKTSAATNRCYTLLGLNGFALFLGLAYLALFVFDARRKKSYGSLWLFRLVERPSGRYIASNRNLLSGILGVVANIVIIIRLVCYLQFIRTGVQLGSAAWGSFSTIPIFLHVFIISCSNLQAYLLLPERYNVPYLSARAANGIYVIGGSLFFAALFVAASIISVYGDRAWYSYLDLVDVLTAHEISWDGASITLVELLTLSPYLTRTTNAVSLYKNSIVTGAAMLSFGPFFATMVNIVAIFLARTLRKQIVYDLDQLLENGSVFKGTADSGESADSGTTLVGSEEKKGVALSRREIRKIAKGTESGNSGLEGEAAKHIAMLQKAERDLLLIGVFLFFVATSGLVFLLWTTIQWGRTNSSGIQWSPAQTEICLFGIMWIYSILVSITDASLFYNIFVHLPPVEVET